MVELAIEMTKLTQQEISVRPRKFAWAKDRRSTSEISEFGYARALY